IEVIPAPRVTVLVDGNAVPVAVAEGAVRAALARADVVMGPMDRVVPVRATPVQEGMEIQVMRVTQEVVEEIEMIPFRTVEWAEPQLPKGTTRIVREGQEGILKKEFRLTYENGQLAHREELGHTVVQEALSRIVGVGTRNDANVIET